METPIEDLKKQLQMLDNEVQAISASLEKKKAEVANLKAYKAEREKAKADVEFTKANSEAKIPQLNEKIAEKTHEVNTWQESSKGWKETADEKQKEYDGLMTEWGIEQGLDEYTLPMFPDADAFDKHNTLLSQLDNAKTQTAIASEGAAQAESELEEAQQKLEEETARVAWATTAIADEEANIADTDTQIKENEAQIAGETSTLRTKEEERAEIQKSIDEQSGAFGSIIKFIDGKLQEAGTKRNEKGANAKSDMELKVNSDFDKSKQNIDDAKDLASVACDSADSDIATAADDMIGDIYAGAIVDRLEETTDGSHNVSIAGSWLEESTASHILNHSSAMSFSNEQLEKLKRMWMELIAKKGTNRSEATTYTSAKEVEKFVASKADFDAFLAEAEADIHTFVANCDNAIKTIQKVVDVRGCLKYDNMFVDAYRSDLFEGIRKRYANGEITFPEMETEVKEVTATSREVRNDIGRRIDISHQAINMIAGLDSTYLKYIGQGGDGLHKIVLGKFAQLKKDHDDFVKYVADLNAELTQIKAASDGHESTFGARMEELEQQKKDAKSVVDEKKELKDAAVAAAIEADNSNAPDAGDKQIAAQTAIDAYANAYYAFDKICYNLNIEKFEGDLKSSAYKEGIDAVEDEILEYSGVEAPSLPENHIGALVKASYEGGDDSGLDAKLDRKMETLKFYGEGELSKGATFPLVEGEEEVPFDVQVSSYLGYDVIPVTSFIEDCYNRPYPGNGADVA